MPLVKPIPPDPAAIGQRDRATAISRRLRSMLTLCSTALAIAISLTSPNPLHACACCTDFGQRDVKVIQLDFIDLRPSGDFAFRIKPDCLRVRWASKKSRVFQFPLSYLI